MQAIMGNEAKIDFFAKLEYHMNLVDTDRTGDLDFYQFCCLGKILVLTRALRVRMSNSRC
jgi:hypothetical protein